MQIFIGFLTASIVAYAAYRAGSLSVSGVLSAVLTGGIIFGLGGWRWAVLLLTFFLTSTLLTRAFKKRKSGLNEKFSKSGQRDAGQVLANGGLATLFVVLDYFFPQSGWSWLGFAAALAAVNADTWATELGVLNPSPPRMLTRLTQIVEKGTSGGVSLTGTLAALAGAGLIGALSVLLASTSVSWKFGILVTLSGLLGAFFDSLLGATVQAIYTCPACQKETERHPLHTCGTETTLKRGWSWLNNDLVNFGCGLFASVCALLFV